MVMPPGWANFHQAGILLETRTVSPATNLFLMNLDGSA